MIYVDELYIHNYKCFKDFHITLNKDVNIIVGNNEAGKSTILEALHLVLSGLLHGHYLKNEISEYLFNYEVAQEYAKSLETTPMEPPRIDIEAYFCSDQKDDPIYENLRGSNNYLKKDCAGIKCSVLFDDHYKPEYERLIENSKTGNKITTIPIEYYKIDWRSFGRDAVTARSIPLKSCIIDSTSTRYQNGSDVYISKIIQDELAPEEAVELSQAYRKLKESFMSDESIRKINDKVTKNATTGISSKKVNVSVDMSVQNSWESVLMTYFDDIPFQQIGQGEQCIVKTNLALAKTRADISNLILLEEPENHLSHTRLNSLITRILDKCEQNQLIITTHSSFVANKLNLKNLFFIHNSAQHKFIDISDDTQMYFKKLAGYETLRLILADKVILVEGPSDELIVQKAFMNQDNSHRLPIECGIDVISVGLSAPRFLDIAERIDIKIAVITDNDHDYSKNIVERYKKYEQNTNIKICSGSDNTLNTLEPQFIAANQDKLENLKETLQIPSNECTDTKSFTEFLTSHKTDWALKVFDSSTIFNTPTYIQDAISWIIK